MVKHFPAMFKIKEKKLNNICTTSILGFYDSDNMSFPFCNLISQLHHLVTSTWWYHVIKENLITIFSFSKKICQSWKQMNLKIQVPERYSRHHSRKEFFPFILGLVIYLAYLSEFKHILFNTKRCLTEIYPRKGHGCEK